jgi:hypothetical protein
MGIESVQPKGISIPQMVGEVVPAATPSAVAQLADAFRQGFITTNDIMEHTGGNALARGLVEKKKMAAEQQLLGEQMDPLAIEARQEATRLSGEKAKGERETALTKDFVGAYLKYNLPLKKANGTPDYSGMAEVGQKYADMERTLAYAKGGMTGTPVKRVDPKTGQEYAVSINAFGEDVTESPGQKNAALDHYRKLFRKASAFLIQNDNEPDIPEGGTAPIISVSPKALQDEAASPMITSLHPEITDGAPTVEEINRAVQSEIDPASRVTPLVGIAQPIPGFTPPAPKVVVEPTATGTAVTVQAPQAVPVEKSVVEIPPYKAGTGVLTGMGDYKPTETVKDARSTELYKNWAERSAAIDAFRAVKQVYAANPNDEITGQNDKDLLTTATQIASMSSSGGSGRAMMNELKLVEAKIPTWDRIKDAPDIVLNRNLFPKPVRDRIISMVERHIKGVESLAGGALKTASDELTSRGIDPARYFSPAERALFGETPGAESAAGGGIERTSTYGGKQYRVRQ